MTEREKVLLRREGAVRATMALHGEWCEADAKTEAARLFPLPTCTVPTVRQGPSGAWYCVALFEAGSLPGGLTVLRFHSRDDAWDGSRSRGINWPPEDQPTVAALLALPLTEEVEDTGEDGAK